MKNEDLRNEVQQLIEEVDKTHRYSMSRIYGAYNQIFERDEKPQACASCLIRKVRELRRWLDETKPAIQDTDSPASAVKKTARKPRKASTKSTK